MPVERPVLDAWIARKIGLPSGKPPARFDIEAYQLSSLNRSLEHACENSFFYRKRFGKVKLNSLFELSRLPFTTSEDLRENAMEMLCVNPGQISRIVTLFTSGSTGKAKRVYFTEDDLALCIDFFHHGMKNLVDRSDAVGILFPAQRPGSVGDLLQKGLNRIGCKSFTLYEHSGDFNELYHMLIRNKVTSLAGFPSILTKLAEYCAVPERADGLNIKSVLISADYVSKACRRTVSDTWNPEIYEHYGMTEMGYGCAVSCAGQLSGSNAFGYHVREADILIEIIDPETGKPVPDGETGEIVFTTLTRRGMPFIRYKTGDMSGWLNEACPCGSCLKLLKRVGNRGIKKGNHV
ncbi:MAG: phenylacetate--CoA ligase [Clostridiales bacterium]|nr:phenylacetate--CoA ligase [Clostridiales bacterium]